MCGEVAECHVFGFIPSLKFPPMSGSKSTELLCVSQMIMNNCGCMQNADGLALWLVIEISPPSQKKSCS